MSMFPHTVTVYHVSTETDPDTLEDTVTNEITVLRGVLLEPSRGISVKGVQLASEDTAALYVPFGVKAVDGVTGEQAVFAPQADGRTFFIKGEAVEPDAAVEDLEREHGHVYQVTRVDALDFGGLPHWEIGGK